MSELQQDKTKDVVVPLWWKRIYVIQDNMGRVKIGISMNVQSRIKNIASSAGVNIQQSYYTEPCQNAIEIERYMHRLYAEHRLGGEWFDISFKEAVEALKTSFVQLASFEMADEKAKLAKLDAGLNSIKKAILYAHGMYDQNDMNINIMNLGRYSALETCAMLNEAAFNLSYIMPCSIYTALTDELLKQCNSVEDVIYQMNLIGINEGPWITKINKQGIRISLSSVYDILVCDDTDFCKSYECEAPLNFEEWIQQLCKIHPLIANNIQRFDEEWKIDGESQIETIYDCSLDYIKFLCCDAFSWERAQLYFSLQEMKSVVQRWCNLGHELL